MQWNFIREYDVDFLFMSLNLAELDGIDVLDIVLREKLIMVSKIFVLSSSDRSAFKDIKEIGAKHFIKKPISKEYFDHFVKPEIDKLQVSK